MELLEKVDESELDVVLNYVRWYASQQQTFAGTQARPLTTRWRLCGSPLYWLASGVIHPKAW
jgi:hypothetical protein